MSYKIEATTPWGFREWSVDEAVNILSAITTPSSTQVDELHRFIEISRDLLKHMKAWGLTRVEITKV